MCTWPANLCRDFSQYTDCDRRIRVLIWFDLPISVSSCIKINSLMSWASYQIRKIAGCACTGIAGNVSPHRRIQRKPRVSDPGMHHGTCVTHVPWCMSGLLTRGGGENVPGISGACASAILRIWQEAHGRMSQDVTGYCEIRGDIMGSEVFRGYSDRQSFEICWQSIRSSNPTMYGKWYLHLHTWIVI